MKLWDKNIRTEDRILSFTTGMDPVFDLVLAPYDILGSMAHVIMLERSGLLEKQDTTRLLEELFRMFHQARKGELKLEEQVEDIHTQVEKSLTEKLGDLGKRIHSGRSRNDQILVDLKLYFRDVLGKLVQELYPLAVTLTDQAEKYSGVLLPGYTHMQVAMPSSFGLWFGGYAESLHDDLVYLKGISSVIDQNPLGSAAGFGSSFPIDRRVTTELLDFQDIHVSSVQAQLSRGKAEWFMASGIGAVASTLSRLAMDCVLFMGQNFRFISLPEELTTGSSIMPHKKNPDVLELIRARCNRLVSLPSSISSVTNNLISGYHRDFQILKEILFPAIGDLFDCILMTDYVVKRIDVNKNILKDQPYQYLFSVEEVNRRVQEGKSFRDAYREVAADIASGNYQPSGDHKYTHLGSIGNPGIPEIRAKLKKSYESFRFVEPLEIGNKLSNYYTEK